MNIAGECLTDKA